MVEQNKQKDIFKEFEANDCTLVRIGNRLEGTYRDYQITTDQHATGVIYQHADPITARSVAQYIQDHAIPENFAAAFQNKQVVEIGAGLAEFSPFWATIATVKPIIIDPVDYRSIQHLLATMQPYSLDIEQHAPTIETLMQRITTILDPTKVTLFNMTVEQAKYEHGTTLRGIADIVIDARGAYVNVPTIEQPYVKEIETQFLPKNPARI